MLHFPGSIDSGSIGRMSSGVILPGDATHGTLPKDRRLAPVATAR